MPLMKISMWQIYYPLHFNKIISSITCVMCMIKNSTCLTIMSTGVHTLRKSFWKGKRINQYFTFVIPYQNQDKIQIVSNRNNSPLGNKHLNPVPPSSQLQGDKSFPSQTNQWSNERSPLHQVTWKDAGKPAPTWVVGSSKSIFQGPQ